MIVFRLVVIRVVFYAVLAALVAWIASLFGVAFVPVWIVLTLLFAIPGMRRETAWARAAQRELAAAPSMSPEPEPEVEFEFVDLPGNEHIAFFTRKLDQITCVFKPADAGTTDPAVRELTRVPTQEMAATARRFLTEKQVAAGQEPWFPSIEGPQPYITPGEPAG